MTVFIAAGTRVKGDLEPAGVPLLIAADSAEEAFGLFLFDFAESMFAKDGWTLVGTVTIRPVFQPVLKGFVPYADPYDAAGPKPSHLHLVE